MPPANPPQTTVFDSSHLTPDERAALAAGGVALDDVALVVAPVRQLQISPARDPRGAEVVVVQAVVIVTTDLLDIRPSGLVDPNGQPVVDARAQRAIVGSSPALRLVVRRESLGAVGAILLGEGDEGDEGDQAAQGA